MTLTMVDTPAAAFIADYLASTLPPGTPPCYRSISGARYVGSGRKRVATAKVVMFDGLPSEVEVFQWGIGGLGHRWITESTQMAYFEDGRWQRESGAA